MTPGGSSNKMRISLKSISGFGQCLAPDPCWGPQDRVSH